MPPTPPTTPPTAAPAAALTPDAAPTPGRKRRRRPRSKSAPEAAPATGRARSAATPSPPSPPSPDQLSLAAMVGGHEARLRGHDEHLARIDAAMTGINGHLTAQDQTLRTLADFVARFEEGERARHDRLDEIKRENAAFYHLMVQIATPSIGMISTLVAVGVSNKLVGNATLNLALFGAGVVIVGVCLLVIGHKVRRWRRETP